MNLADMNYIEILKNNSIIDKECIKSLEGKLIKKDNEIIRLNKQIAQIEQMYDEKLKEVIELREENEASDKLLKVTKRNYNGLIFENEQLKKDVDDWRRILDDTNHVNEELIERVVDLEDELEMAIKGQEDFKKIIKDLEEINREVMEELKNANNWIDILEG